MTAELQQQIESENEAEKRAFSACADSLLRTGFSPGARLNSPEMRYLLRPLTHDEWTGSIYKAHLPEPDSQEKNARGHNYLFRVRKLNEEAQL